MNDEFDTIAPNIIINSIVTNDLQATFDISVIGTDIQAWAFSVDGGAPVQGTTTTFTVELASDGVHNILFDLMELEIFLLTKRHHLIYCKMHT